MGCTSRSAGRDTANASPLLAGWVLTLILAISLPSQASGANRAEASCRRVRCSGHGLCVIRDGEPVCACDDGYVVDQRTGLSCIRAHENSRRAPGDYSRSRSRGATERVRRVRVVSKPPDLGVAMDRRGGWFTTPHSFPVDGEAHRVTLRGGASFKNAEIVVPESLLDVVFYVEMDRPVFEAGIGLTIVGGLMAIAGAATLGVGVDAANSGDSDVDDTVGPTECIAVGAPLLAVGGGMTIAGIVMMLLDDQREPVVRMEPVRR